MTRRCFFASLLTACVVSTSMWAATRPSLASTWRNTDIPLDATDAGATDAQIPIPGLPASISVVNDDTHVFVRIRTGDPATMQQIVRGGLLVWFDAKGGDSKTFGVRYPVGTPPPNPDGDQRGERSGERGAGRPPGKPGPALRAPSDRKREAAMAELMTLIPARLEVYGPKNDDIRSLVLAYATGLSVSLARVDEALVVELTVPLRRDADHPYAIGAAAGASVGLGLQSPKIASAGGGLQTLGGMAGGGMGGGRPGGGSPRTGRSDDERKPAARPKPFMVWQTLVLAKAGAS